MDPEDPLPSGDVARFLFREIFDSLHNNVYVVKRSWRQTDHLSIVNLLCRSNLAVATFSAVAEFEKSADLQSPSSVGRARSTGEESDRLARLPVRETGLSLVATTINL